MKTKGIMKRMMLALMLTLAVSIVVPEFSFQGNNVSVVQAAAKPKLSKKQATLLKGKTLTLKMKGISGKVKWKSSDKKVASVNSKGKVTAKKKGKATITAKVNGKSYKCKITVVNAKLNATDLYLVPGDTYKLKVLGTSKKVTWKSDDKKVATVNSNGVVKMSSKGYYGPGDHWKYDKYCDGKVKITAIVGGEKYTCVIYADFGTYG